MLCFELSESADRLHNISANRLSTRNHDPAIDHLTLTIVLNPGRGEGFSTVQRCKETTAELSS